MNETVGIIGGTGPAGRGVAVRLAQAGYHVVIGSRDKARGIEVAGELPAGPGRLDGGDNADAAACDIVIAATPWDSLLATVVPLREALAGRLVISMANALVKQGRELVPLLPARGSMTAEVAAALPASLVTGAFHHLPASEMENLNSGLEADVIVVGDDADARRRTCELVSAMPGLTAVEGGSLALAGAVESFTAVCISINIRHRAHTYVRLAGLGH